MKTKLKYLGLLILPFAAAVSFARAEEPPAGPPADAPAGPPADAPAGEHHSRDGKKMRERRMAQLDEKLSLTADQKQKINAIWDKAAADMKASDQPLSRDERMEKMKATRTEVRGVLTAEQQKIFDAMPPEGRGRHGPHADGEAPPPAPVPAP
ncbi:MAG: hypothetical protein JWM32_1817 [Verrucomicrobia bacterium]|nr:hypothetical protein [Verrucomicrobiota bacterium]